MIKKLPIALTVLGATFLAVLIFHGDGPARFTGGGATTQDRKDPTWSLEDRDSSHDESMLVPAHELFRGILEHGWSQTSFAKVTEVHNDYGFVVIDAGSNRDIKIGTLYTVRREGDTIANVSVVHVEETEAVADIQRNSVSEGIDIERGDEIVVEPNKMEVQLHVPKTSGASEQ